MEPVRIHHYKVVSSFKLDELAKAVEGEITKNKWQPLGGITAITVPNPLHVHGKGDAYQVSYIQPMVKVG